METFSQRLFSDIFNSTNNSWDYYSNLCDGSINTDDGSVFKIHRILLSQRSLFFRSLFNFNSSNTEVKDVTVHGIKGSTLNHVLLYVYSGIAYLDEDNICEMLVASDYLLMDDLLKECETYAVKNMTPKNCLQLMMTSQQFEKLMVLLNSCIRFAKINFEDILSAAGNELSGLPLKALVELLKDDCLNVTSERSVWEGILLWVNKVPSERSCYAIELIRCLRLGDTDDDIAKEILNDPMMLNNPICKELSLNILKDSSSGIIEDTADYNKHREMEEYRLRLPHSFHAVTYYSVSENESGSELYITYDDRLDYWRHLVQLRFYPEVLLPIDKYIYIFNTWENITACYDILEEQLNSLPPMFVPRFNYCVLALHNKIFTLGGVDDLNEDTLTVEVYDKDANVWEPTQRMWMMILSDAVACNGRLYAFGHSRNEDTVMINQAYDPETGAWRFQTPSSLLRRAFSAVAFHQQIYVVGGENPDGCLRDVERYDPNTDEWKTLPSLPFTYFAAKANIVAGTLIVYDNNHEDTRFYSIPPPAYWDECNEEWKIIEQSSPFYKIEHYRFCTFEGADIVKEVVFQNRVVNVKWERSSLA